MKNYGVIHIVRTHNGGRGGLTQMRTSAYKGKGGCQGDVRMHKNSFCIDFKRMIQNYFTSNKRKTSITIFCFRFQQMRECQCLRIFLIFFKGLSQTCKYSLCAIVFFVEGTFLLFFIILHYIVNDYTYLYVRFFAYLYFYKVL